MSYNFSHWHYISPHSKPQGKQAKFFMLAEKLVNPEKQLINRRSCYYEGDVKKLGQLQKEFPLDKMGRKIFFNIDRVIVLTYCGKDLLYWKPLYMKGKRVVLQCINPGYESYRCMRAPDDVLVITDQILANELRYYEQYEMIATGKHKIDYKLVEV